MSTRPVVDETPEVSHCRGSPENEHSRTTSDNGSSDGCSFRVFLKDAFPINVMHAIKRVPEICHVFCATANPVQVVIAEGDAVAEAGQGRGILGVIDGSSPNGVETDDDIACRKDFLRTIGYKG